MGEIHPWMYKKEKHRLFTTIDYLNFFAETRIFSSQEIELKYQSNEKIACLLQEEEITSITLIKKIHTIGHLSCLSQNASYPHHPFSFVHVVTPL